MPRLLIQQGSERCGISRRCCFGSHCVQELVLLEKKETKYLARCSLKEQTLLFFVVVQLKEQLEGKEIYRKRLFCRCLPLVFRVGSPCVQELV